MVRRLLDLFCGAGGASMGYYQAGFDVVGVDIRPQPNYPFEFHQSDAFEFLRFFGSSFDFIHASPPCQRYSLGSQRWQPDAWPDYIADLRRLLQVVGVPWVIENVQGAPLRRDLVLCGVQFGLGVIRHRVFESSLFLPRIPHLVGHPSRGSFCTVAGHGGNGPASLSSWSVAMGIDWMNKAELRESIPPVYTRYIGRFV